MRQIEKVLSAFARYGWQLRTNGQISFAPRKHEDYMLSDDGTIIINAIDAVGLYGTIFAQDKCRIVKANLLVVAEIITVCVRWGFAPSDIASAVVTFIERKKQSEVNPRAVGLVIPSCYKLDWSGWTTRVDASDPTEIMRRMQDGNDVFIRKAERGFALYGEGLDCSAINEEVAQSVAGHFAKSRGGWA